MDFTSFISFIE